MKRLPAIALALLLAAPSARAAVQARQAEPAPSIGSALDDIRGPKDALRAGKELARLGKAGLEPLFARLCGEPELPALQSFALVSALGALPRESLIGFLDHLARAEAGPRERRAALDLLARLGGRGELKLALDLAATEGEEPPAPELVAALESTLSAIVSREDGAARALAGFFASAPANLQASIASTLARAGGEDASGLLAGLLGVAGAEIDAVLLYELARAANGSAHGDDQLVLERVRGYLNHPDRRLGVLACQALEKLRDHQAVPDLVVLLDDSNPSLRQRAHAALRGLTGLELGAEAKPWLAWLAESLAWWDERGDDCRTALVSGAPAEAAAALHEVASQRLFLGDVVQVLELALQRPELDLARSACRALHAIHDPSARTALEGALTRTEPEVLAAVHEALAWDPRPPRVPRPQTIPTLSRSVNP